MSINKAIFSGNLTRDAELRSTGGGTAVLNFSVAVNDRRKNQQTGEWEDYPNFIDCTMFGARAEKIAQYLEKGTKVFVEGKLHWSQWEKDGQKRSKVDVTVDEIEFGGKKEGGSSGNGYVQKPASQHGVVTYTSPTASQYTTNHSVSIYDEDLPF